jgi:hypothetical protein
LITGEQGKRGTGSRLIKDPVRIPVPTPLKSIVAGLPFSIGIDRAGSVWMWGASTDARFLPEQSDLVGDGQFAARKVFGIPPAKTVAGLGRTYVVTEQGELRIWGITQPSGAKNPSGSRVPHRVQGICPVESVSASSDVVFAICQDGRVYRDIVPGYRAPSGKPCRFTFCTDIAEVDEWKELLHLKDIRTLLVTTAAYEIALINQHGFAYRGRLDGTEFVLEPSYRLEGPLDLEP